MQNKKETLLFLLIVILGFLLRAYHLGGQSLWYDEICTANRINYTLSETVKRLFVSPFPPLYYIVMNLWVKIFGNGEFALRFPSLIFSVLSIIFVFKLSKELFGKETAFISAFLLSISPYSINYSQEAKMYAMLWFFSVFSFLFFYRFCKDDKFSNIALYVTAAVLAIYTMYIGFIFIVVQNIIYFIFFGGRRLKKWLLGQVLIVILYIPWVSKFIYVAIHRPDIQWIHKTENYFNFLTNAFNLLTGISLGRKIFLEPWLYLSLIISVLFGIILEIKKHHRLPLSYSLIGLWIIIPVIIYCLIDVLIHPILQVRYMGFIHIPLIILFSAGLVFYVPKIRAFILILLLLITFSTHLSPYYKENLKISGEDYRGMLKELQKKIKEGDLIVSNFNPGIATYYYKDHEILRYENLERYTENIESNGSIFFLWRDKRPEENNLQGYKVVDDYSAKGVGFLKLKKNKGRFYF